MPPRRRRGTRAPELGPDSAAKDPLGLAARIEPFVEWLGITGYAPDTVHVRRLYLRYFVAWCDERGIGRPEEITAEILERYQRWLYAYRKSTGQPLTLQSQHGRMLALRAWFRWMAKSGMLPHNPAADIELPRLPRHQLPHEVLTIAEAEQVLAQPDVATATGIRDRAILETLYSTAMRRTELLMLGCYDVDLEKGTVLIRHAKGRKQRTVPIGERALAWIDKYVTEARPQLVVGADPGNLFLTSMGVPFTPNHLSQMARNYVLAAGIGKEGACHLFRHTAATLMLENGADIRFIQELLGHAELTTTQIYTRVSIRKLKEIHQATHPSAKLASSRSGAAHQALDVPDAGEEG